MLRPPALRAVGAQRRFAAEAWGLYRFYALGSGIQISLWGKENYSWRKKRKRKELTVV